MMWFVITLPPKLVGDRLEKAIERGLLRSHLFREDVVIYVPIIKRVANGHSEEILLYEGYAFLGLSDNSNAIRFFEGFEDRYDFLFVLQTVVRKKTPTGRLVDDRVPAQISQDVIDDVKEQCSGFKIKKKERVRSQDRIRIITGIFRGFEGVVKQISSLSNNVFVDVFFLGTNTSIRVDKEDLEKI